MASYSLSVACFDTIKECYDYIKNYYNTVVDNLNDDLKELASWNDIYFTIYEKEFLYGGKVTDVEEILGNAINK
jgi:hypothetical protein